MYEVWTKWRSWHHAVWHESHRNSRRSRMVSWRNGKGRISPSDPVSICRLWMNKLHLQRTNGLIDLFIATTEKLDKHEKTHLIDLFPLNNHCFMYRILEIVSIVLVLLLWKNISHFSQRKAWVFTQVPNKKGQPTPWTIFIVSKNH